MLKDWNLFLFTNLVKVIHVELPDERGKLFMFKVFGQNLILEELFIFDNEAIAIICPFNDVVIFLLL
jgi:hypothetical protein